MFPLFHSNLNTCTKGANFIFAEQKLHVGMPTLHHFAFCILHFAFVFVLSTKTLTLLFVTDIIKVYVPRHKYH